MITLYKKVENILYYAEIWETDPKTAIFHYGKVGTIGNEEILKGILFTSLQKKVAHKIHKLRKAGYQEIDIDDHQILVIEFLIEGWGTEIDLKKRHKLQARMQETLGWNGLGFCDGGSIGSGSMEVTCFVVDFDIAKKVISEDLKGTEFENYSKIYLESSDCES